MTRVPISRVNGDAAVAELVLPGLRPGPAKDRKAASRRLDIAPRLSRVAIAWLLPLTVLVLWTLSAVHEWIPTQILPSPRTVWTSFHDLLQSGELADHTLISVQRVLYGFGAGAGVGLLLGVGMGLSPVFKDYVYPTFKAFALVPPLGWLPLLMMWVGIDEALKVILIAKAAAVPVALNTCQGIRDVPAKFVDVARVFGMSRAQLLQRVVFPAAFPPIWNGVRYGLTHSWLALVVVELLASSEGLGYLIVYGRQLYQLDIVLAAVVVVGALGFALDRVLGTVEARLLRWRRDAF